MRNKLKKHWKKNKIPDVDDRHLNSIYISIIDGSSKLRSSVRQDESNMKINEYQRIGKLKNKKTSKSV